MLDVAQFDVFVTPHHVGKLGERNAVVEGLRGQAVQAGQYCFAVLFGEDLFDAANLRPAKGVDRCAAESLSFREDFDRRWLPFPDADLSVDTEGSQNGRMELPSHGSGRAGEFVRLIEPAVEDH